MIRSALHILNMSVNTLIAVLFVLSGLATRVSPDTWVIPSVLALGFSALMALNVFFVIYWIIRRKKNFALSLACLVLMSDVISNQFVVCAKDEEDQQDVKAVTLLSYNVQLFDLYRKKNGSKILSYILEADADIVCLQEFGWYDKPGFISETTLKQTLGKRYKYHYVVCDPNFGGRATYGIATYSKYPIIHKDLVRYTTHFNRTSTCDVVIGNDTLHVVNCHLESNLLTNDDRKQVQKTIDSTSTTNLNKTSELLVRKMGHASKIRARQADSIAAYVKRLKGKKIIVCGDLNDHPASYTYQTIRDDLSDAFIEETSNAGFGTTYNAFPFYYRIDYVLNSDNLSVDNFRTGKEKLSDHYPISVNILLNK